MKNLKYFPYERNRYFFGKLMTVTDFDAEQRYVNDKRRLQNRLLAGVGVLCGLNVVQVDDTVISLEPGVALDALGREIVVDVPMIKKLSMIPGFDQMPDNATLYLCIEYDEQEREPVYSVAGAGMQGEGINHNKIGEGYKLSLTDQKPDPALFMDALRSQTLTLLDQLGVSARLILPRFARAGGEFEVKLLIEKHRQKQPLTLDAELALTCATYESGYMLKISFDETQHIAKDAYELSYTLRAADMKDAFAGIASPAGALACSLGERKLNLGAGAEAQIELCQEDEPERILSEYAQLGLDDIASALSRVPVVLARIDIVGAGVAYAIDRIQTMPFGQWVIGMPLRSLLESIDRQDILRLKERMDKLDSGGVKGAEHSSAPPDIGDIRAGFVTIDLPMNARAGERYYSQELMHGLGLGHVFIGLGVCRAGNGYQPTLFGDASIFQNRPEYAGSVGRAAALAHPDRGTFVIGVELRENVADAQTVIVRWWAIRDASQRALDVQGRSFALRPDIAYIAARESIVFEPVALGLASADCTFDVKEAEGGVIEPSGKYTAPNQPGVYEVIARSLADSTLSASAFVVVRDKE